MTKGLIKKKVLLRNKKRNWRKNVSVEDVEDYLQDVGLHQQLESTIGEKLDEDLFLIDNNDKSTSSTPAQGGSKGGGGGFGRNLKSRRKAGGDNDKLDIIASLNDLKCFSLLKPLPGALPCIRKNRVSSARPSSRSLSLSHPTQQSIGGAKKRLQQGQGPGGWCSFWERKIERGTRKRMKENANCGICHVDSLQGSTVGMTFSKSGRKKTPSAEADIGDAGSGLHSSSRLVGVDEFSTDLWAASEEEEVKGANHSRKSLGTHLALQVTGKGKERNGRDRMTSASMSASSTNWIDSQTAKHILNGIRQWDVALPAAIHKRDSVLPAIEVPHPGTSYNPDYDQHQRLLLDAAEVESRMQRAVRKEQKQMRATSAGKMTQQEKEDGYFQEMTQGLKLFETEGEQPPTEGAAAAAAEVKVDSQSQQEKEGEGNCLAAGKQDETADASSLATAAAGGAAAAVAEEEGGMSKSKEGQRKTEKKRRKERRVKLQEAALRRKKMARKRRGHEFHNLRSLVKEIETTEGMQKERQERRRKEREEKKRTKPAELSRYKYEEAELDLNLSEELRGNLVGIKTEGNLLLDVQKSMQRRNIIEPRIWQRPLKTSKKKKFFKKGFKIDEKELEEYCRLPTDLLQPQPLRPLSLLTTLR